MVMPKSNSPLVSDLSSTPSYLVMLNTVLNFSVCLAAESSLNPCYRDVLAGVAASVSLVIDAVNRSNAK